MPSQRRRSTVSSEFTGGKSYILVRCLTHGIAEALATDMRADRSIGNSAQLSGMDVIVHKRDGAFDYDAIALHLDAHIADTQLGETLRQKKGEFNVFFHQMEEEYLGRG